MIKWTLTILLCLCALSAHGDENQIARSPTLGRIGKSGTNRLATISYGVSTNALCWPLSGQDDGTNKYDHSTNANDGYAVTAAAEPLWVTNAYQFNGTDDYVDLGDWSKTVGSILDGDWTIAWWQKITDDGGEQAVFGNVNDGVNTILTFLNNSEFGYDLNAIQFQIRDEDGGSLTQIRTDNVITMDVWEHIILTRSNNTAIIYVDTVNVLQGSVSGINNVADFDYNLPWGAKNNQGSIVLYTNGELNGPFIFNRFLTASERTALFNLGN